MPCDRKYSKLLPLKISDSFESFQHIFLAIFLNSHDFHLASHRSFLQKFRKHFTNIPNRSIFQSVVTLFPYNLSSSHIFMIIFSFFSFLLVIAFLTQPDSKAKSITRRKMFSLFSLLRAARVFCLQFPSRLAA